MDSTTRQFLVRAGQTARLRYPGAVGELLSKELFSWMTFGHQLGSNLIMDVATEVLAEDTPHPQAHGLGRDSWRDPHNTAARLRTGVDGESVGQVGLEPTT
jgi:hypothetical protein